MSSGTVKMDVLVTGASGTIGSAIARALAKSGFNLHLTSRALARLTPLVKELTGLGAQVETYEADLVNVRQCEKAVDAFFGRAKNPYGLVCNAGDLGVLGTFLRLGFDEWSAAVQKNFVAHAAMVHSFGRCFVSGGRKGGSIVLLSGAGLGGTVAHTHISAYGTSKAALTYLAEGLAEEFKELDITINAIAPGQVNSGVTAQAIRAGVEQAGLYAKKAEESMKNGGVSPDLGAQLVAYLMGPEARKITGRLLSARFDQERLRKEVQSVAGDADLYRLRRIDNDLFSKRK